MPGPGIFRVQKPPAMHDPVVVRPNVCFIADLGEGFQAGVMRGYIER